MSSIECYIVKKRMESRKFRRYTIKSEDLSDVSLTLEEIKLLYLHAAEVIEKQVEEEGKSVVFISPTRYAVLKLMYLIEDLQKKHYE